MTAPTRRMLAAMMLAAGCGAGADAPVDAAIDAVADAPLDAPIVIERCKPAAPPRCADPSVVASSGTFAPQRFTPAGHNTYAIGAGDLDDDCHLDVVVTNADDDDVGVLRGNGDGSLQPQVSYPVGDFPITLVVADLDQDGVSDVAVSGVNVLLAQAGGLAAPVMYRAAATDLVAVDLDDSGCVDLVSATHVMLNGGDGRFAVRQVAVDAFRVAAGDFDGDGAPDLAVTEHDGEVIRLTVRLNDGTGGLRAPVRYGDDDASGGLAAGDLDGDGDVNLVTVGGIGSWSVVKNRGDGTFAAPAPMSAATDHAWQSPALADLDGDGDLDLVAASPVDYNPPRAGTSVSVFLNLGDGTFAAPVDHGVSSGIPAKLVIHDLDRDGRRDLLVSNQRGGVTVLLANP